MLRSAEEIDDSTKNELASKLPYGKNGLGQREKEIKEVREWRQLTGERTCKEWIGKGMINEGKRNLEARMTECEKISVEEKWLGKDSYKTWKSLDD